MLGKMCGIEIFMASYDKFHIARFVNRAVLKSSFSSYRFIFLHTSLFY